MDLRQRWTTLAKETLTVPESISWKWWEHIEQRYNESQRHYHTLRHLEEMFQHFDQFQNELIHPELVSLAIFFHDIIYDPKAPDNEERSADVFVQFSQEAGNLKENQVEKVKEWILLTKAHTIQDNAEKDLQYFLDMDMAVLGRSSEEYKKYAEQIRKEYSHVPDPEFRKRRSAILQDFTQRQRIFASDEFNKMFHGTAIQNMKDEILILRSKPTI
ncbi:uncharacterized protein LOC125648151 isoform X2 [Ostrea edulis]|nr:uncharacterized protein LOC125648151 isoform X2 [Ostrea edulis]XP_048731045.1 uncharacterized protein LOC125648151 isoform X2 [Ostrea edulis]XP_048731046.1 uncharacterized protein LOC125648151 isoform X2 [Ostrea edulis]